MHAQQECTWEPQGRSPQHTKLRLSTVLGSGHDLKPSRHTPCLRSLSTPHCSHRAPIRSTASCSSDTRSRPAALQTHPTLIRPTPLSAPPNTRSRLALQPSPLPTVRQPSCRFPLRAPRPSVAPQDNARARHTQLAQQETPPWLGRAPSGS